MQLFFDTSPLTYRKIFADEYYSSGYFPPTGTMGQKVGSFSNDDGDAEDDAL